MTYHPRMISVESLLLAVKGSQLTWFGHLVRMSSRCLPEEMCKTCPAWPFTAIFTDAKCPKQSVIVHIGASNGCYHMFFFPLIGCMSFKWHLEAASSANVKQPCGSGIRILRKLTNSFVSKMKNEKKQKKQGLLISLMENRLWGCSWRDYYPDGI